MTIECLKEKYNEKVPRIGKGWSWRDIELALLDAKKATFETKGLDSTNVEKPNRNMVNVYHLSLMLLDSICQRSCAPKPVHQEVAKGSERSMLANVFAILVARCMVVPNAQTISVQLHFDDDRASPGTKLAR